MWAAGPRVLLVHPCADLYGSDRVALESARAFVGAGARVRVVLAQPGPLVDLLSEAGCDVQVQPFPVLRRAYLSPSGLVRLLGLTVRTLPGMLRLLRASRPDVVYVSTVTIPWWLLLARLSRARVVCHVHEAEDLPRPLRFALSAPLLLAHHVVANSRASEDVVVAGMPRLRSRVEVVYNGVPGPGTVTPPRTVLQPPVRLVLVGRVSARKGTDVAVAALAKLRERGIDATLDLVGGVFPGYEWYQAQVRDQITSLGLSDQVRWRGVCSEVWPTLAEADVALVPSSQVESFGNAAVEGMLAGRPVIASRVQGLSEIVRQGENGWLVRPGDPDDLAAAVAEVVEHWPTACELAERARQEAASSFGPATYHERIVRATLPNG